LNLTVDAFTRLMAINNKAKEWESDTRLDRVSSEEWREVYSILVQSQKVALYAAWIQEEKTENIRLDPRLFWPSLREPQQGEWPPAQVNTPLVDPDILALDDLPEPTFAREIIELWQSRATALAGIRKELADLYLADTPNGFAAVLQRTFGDPIPVDMDRLLNVLNQGLPKNDPALRAARSRLRMICC
jgi:hypothetical protein